MERYNYFEVDPKAPETISMQIRNALEAAHLSGAVPPRLDLTRAQLAGIELNGIQIPEALLVEACLKGSFLKGADLSRVDMRLADEPPRVS